ncbi:MAG: C39 family peptidase [bacterium]|nr:C39 family peptidase [bacterium]
MKNKKIILIFLILFSLLALFYPNRLSIRRIIIKSYYQLQAAILPLALDKESSVKLDVPFHRQERALSCEIATLRMVLNYYGLQVSEKELLAKLPFETSSSRQPGNVWGNPNLGFVGNINGRMPDSGYGVYEEPIALVANQYREAKALRGTTLVTILQEVVNGRPVIVWGHISSGKDISWRTTEGEYIKAIYGEHTKIITGFYGTASNPEYLILLDPIYGKVVWRTDKFLQNWASLDNRAVVVY